MGIRFYLDPETGQPHIYRHAVSEEEVITAYQLGPKALRALRRRREKKV